MNLQRIELIKFGAQIENFVLEQHQRELSDFEHMRYSRQNEIQHSTQTIVDYVNLLENLGGHFYFLKLVSDQSVVGSITIKPHKLKSAEIGILIYRRYSNFGFGTEAMHIVRTKLVEMGFKVMFAGTKIDHFAMRRILEKSGMQIATLRNFPKNKFAEPTNIYFETKLI